jgi:hypothetical protein
MKSLVCPSCGCIAHISDHMEQVKDYANCEMCGSSPYLYDGEVEPFTFPGQKDAEDADSEKTECKD